ncbi:07ccb300-9706-4137-9678-5f04e468e32c [Sclerotinia trifoliorum]|uniref:07ccb300-9706-4137-9678-5f04e468e32c n=1 Tax=Sclerotinia trifoliorum TaxID=28548 RepID=A0A8H2ZTG9_9HELO|nr:07ccb300-9706-4137-9678-5f04e468e32c [Sclerotinia trifoliorum]
MPIFSTLEALTNLTQAIPDWNKRLDDLNSQIALRQIELARLVDTKPARSLKNKGSTESLRPKDGEEIINEAQDTIEKSSPLTDSPKSAQNGTPTTVRPNSPSVARAAAAAALEYNQSSSEPQPQAESPKPLTPRASPTALNRQSSQPTPQTEPLPRAPAILRKRKTESLASGTSQAPRYRTRSMIIVYYDSAVQTAFEELVKFVSGNRNAMRKGKMAAKMAEMRRAAEMEAEEESDDESESEASKALGSALPKPSLHHQVASQETSNRVQLNGGDTGAGTKLKFTSTRNMGASRDRMTVGNTMNVLRGYRRAGAGGIGGSATDIFDELDKGLEWCQGQCEHAAHQFLRDGECSTEIENIKKRLAEVRDIAEQKMGKLRMEQELEKKDEVSNSMSLEEDSHTNGTKFIPAIAPIQDGPVVLEVDDNMEVDDEEDDNDIFDPRKLIFKRSGDVAY